MQGQCDVCHNHYSNVFQVQLNGRTYTFDCFECAIHLLAPRCGHCGCRVIGHGTEASGEIYCCAHCARSEGGKEVVDHAREVAAPGAVMRASR